MPRIRCEAERRERFIVRLDFPAAIEHHVTFG
jgi:hypothetical protein